jgi:hypothetical protein
VDGFRRLIRRQSALAAGQYGHPFERMAFEILAFATLAPRRGARLRAVES